MTNHRTLKLSYSAVCLALALVLPFLIGQIPQIGQMLCPMHIPVLLCGFLCGWPWGMMVGFFAPLLRSVLFGMPVIFPNGLAMAFELACYGFVSGFLFRKLNHTALATYIALLSAMLAGRCIWGIVRYVLAGLSGSAFPWSAFIAGAVLNAIPGIILHIALIPVIVFALQRAGLILE